MSLKSPLWIVTSAALGLSALAAGCIAWSTDQQGNLQSVGLPGVPVWTAQKPSPKAPLAEGQASAAELSRDETGGSSWLDELNKWREAAGLEPVAENIRLSDGSRQHADYLLENAREQGGSVAAAAMTMGAAMHTESPGSVGFSEQGVQAARGGPHVVGVMQTADIAWSQYDPKADIDSLLMVPFHRLSLLAPWAEVAGYGAAGKFPERVAALALRGRQGRDADLTVRFPPQGSKIAFAAMKSPEWPNPLASCPGYLLPVGLPITLQLPNPANLGSYSVTDLTTGQKLAACAFDAETYDNPDGTQQTYAHHALAANRAIVVIPRYPLQAGHQYQVEIQAGNEYQWSFEIIQPSAQENLAIR